MRLNISNLKRPMAVGVIFAFLANVCVLPPAYAQLHLPPPGQMVALSPAFNPAVLKGIQIDPKDPFRFHFFVDMGDTNVGAGSKPAQNRDGLEPSPTDLKNESTKLIKYFLASLTIPEQDLWVNLSPYEKNRVVPKEFGQTEMGRDLLAQDYLLKQITASLIYPEGETGKQFWDMVYKQAKAQYGTINIPINTFNKVWIVPEKAVVYENGGTAFVLENHLKVMLEEDYLAMSKHSDVGAGSKPAQNRDGLEPSPTKINQIGSQIVRSIVIPALTKEVNEGKNFAQLRQVFYSLILATWYKKKIKDSILNKVYANRNKIAGVNVSEQDKDKIYQEYLKAFKKGVFNYIKEEPLEDVSLRGPAKLYGGDEAISKRITIPRKYFSGGVNAQQISVDMAIVGPNQVFPKDFAQLGSIVEVDGDFGFIKPTDQAMINSSDNLEKPTIDFISLAKKFLALSAFQQVSFIDTLLKNSLKKIGQNEIGLHYVAEWNVDAVQKSRTLRFNDKGAIWFYNFPKDGSFVRLLKSSHVVLLNLNHPSVTSLRILDDDRQRRIYGEPLTTAFPFESWLVPEVVNIGLNSDEKKIFGLIPNEPGFLEQIDNLYQFMRAVKICQAILRPQVIDLNSVINTTFNDMKIYKTQSGGGTQKLGLDYAMNSQVPADRAMIENVKKPPQTEEEIQRALGNVFRTNRELGIIRGSSHLRTLEPLLFLLFLNKDLLTKYGLTYSRLFSGKILNIGIESTDEDEDLRPNNLVSMLKVEGFDISGLSPLANLAKGDPQSGYYKGKVQDMRSFMDGEFDTIVSFSLFGSDYWENILNYGTEEYRKAAGEIARVLKPNGVLLLEENVYKEFLHYLKESGLSVIPFASPSYKDKLVGYICIKDNIPKPMDRAMNGIPEINESFGKQMGYSETTHDLFIDGQKAEFIAQGRRNDIFKYHFENGKTVIVRIVQKEGENRDWAAHNIRFYASRELGINLYGRGFTPDGHYYMVVEYVDGDSLDNIKNLNKENLELVKSLLDQLINQKIYMLDFTPEQLMIGRRDSDVRNRILIADGEIAETHQGPAWQLIAKYLQILNKDRLEEWDTVVQRREIVDYLAEKLIKVWREENPDGQAVELQEILNSLGLKISADRAMNGQLPASVQTPADGVMIIPSNGKTYDDILDELYRETRDVVDRVDLNFHGSEEEESFYRQFLPLDREKLESTFMELLKYSHSLFTSQFYLYHPAPVIKSLSEFMETLSRTDTQSINSFGRYIYEAASLRGTAEMHISGGEQGFNREDLTRFRKEFALFRVLLLRWSAKPIQEALLLKKGTDERAIKAPLIKFNYFVSRSPKNKIFLSSLQGCVVQGQGHKLYQFLFRELENVKGTKEQPGHEEERFEIAEVDNHGQVIHNNIGRMVIKPLEGKEFYVGKGFEKVLKIHVKEFVLYEAADQGQQIYSAFLQKLPGVTVVESNKMPDKAMAIKGGIDFNPAQMSMQVQYGSPSTRPAKAGLAQDDPARGGINPAQITGATFTIRTMTPVTDLARILGISEVK